MWQYQNIWQDIVRDMDARWEGKQKPINRHVYYAVRRLLRAIGGYPDYIGR